MAKKVKSWTDVKEDVLDRKKAKDVESAEEKEETKPRRKKPGARLPVRKSSGALKPRSSMPKTTSHWHNYSD